MSGSRFLKYYGLLLCLYFKWYENLVENDTQKPIDFNEII